jgi:hypothetical protein
MISTEERNFSLKAQNKLQTLCFRVSPTGFTQITCIDQESNQFSIWDRARIAFSILIGKKSCSDITFPITIRNSDIRALGSMCAIPQDPKVSTVAQTDTQNKSAMPMRKKRKYNRRKPKAGGGAPQNPISEK